MWLDAGTQESAHEIDDMRKLRDALVHRGWQEGHDLLYGEIQGGKHDEAAWALRVDPISAISLPCSIGRRIIHFFAASHSCRLAARSSRSLVPKERPPTILCVSSYEKGQEFMRTCKREGWDVFLLTVEKLRDADWPREAITEAFYLPEELPLQGLINAVSYMARSRPIDRIVALDEFDMENVAALREHLRIPGMGLTTMRYFRDKLAMRGRAREEGIAVPEFVHVLNYDDLRDFMARVKAPWLLKPRSQASGIGMKIIKHESELWPWLDQLGDAQSFYLLEQFVTGDIFHVDSIVSERQSSIRRGARIRESAARCVPRRRRVHQPNVAAHFGAIEIATENQP